MSAPANLYIHVPFCRHRCHYCDFSVTTPRNPPLDAWFEAIDLELERVFEGHGWERPAWLETVYVGGGTPSLLRAEGMERLRFALSRYFRWEPARLEWTAEANPDSLSGDLCAAWRGAGVNRLSVGVQSLDDDVLRWLGRLHDGAEAVAAIDRARDAGFERLSVDLMFGLPDEVLRNWTREVETVAGLGVTHVSAYGLTVEPRTPLARWVATGRVREPSEERYEAEYLEVSALLTSAGYGHYEVSNFALPGGECLHNRRYWDGSPYLGIGPSAHSFLPPVRRWNVFRWDAYRRAIQSGRDGRAGQEEVIGERAELERLWLGLRTAEGISRTDPLWALLGDGALEVVDRAVACGWLREEAGRVRPTPRGWLRLDALVTEIAAAAKGSAAREGWAELPLSADAPVERS